MRKYIIERTKKLQIAVLFLMAAVFLMVPDIKADAFCTAQSVLDSRTETVFKDGSYASMTQGFCIAEHYMIRTRWKGDAEPTIYQVIDLETMKEVGHYSFNTGHSNSITYNPDMKEVVCVTDGAIHRFYFFDGELEGKDVIQDESFHFVKCAYVSSAKCYYISTGEHTFKTRDFIDIEETFNPRTNGINQGMGSDGEYLYVSWSKSDAEEIDVYALDGKLVRTLKISHSLCKEAEEVDFYKGDMYINENLANPGKILKVTGHDFKNEEMIKEPTCGTDGIVKRVCKICGYEEEAIVKATGEHVPGKEKILKEPTCTENGEFSVSCKVCGKEIKRGKVKATGHEFEKYKTVKKATFMSDGKKVRVCKKCHYEETKKVKSTKNKIKDILKLKAQNI